MKTFAKTEPELRPLFVPLRREWFEAFEAGHKTFEYRPYGPRWNEKTCKIGRPVTLSLGYGKQRRLSGIISSFEKSKDVTRTTAWISCYGNKPDAIAAKIGILLDERNTASSVPGTSAGPDKLPCVVGPLEEQV